MLACVYKSTLIIYISKYRLHKAIIRSVSGQGNIVFQQAMSFISR